MPDPIRIDGLNDFVRALKRLDADRPKALRVAFNRAAKIVLDDAQPRVPSRSGRARSSMRARSTQRNVQIVEGGKRALYMPWLDFGGRVGRHKSVRRPFKKSGRYVWESYANRHTALMSAVLDALTEAAEAAGLEVS